MGAPIDRTAKTALDSNLVNGNISDAPKIKSNNDQLYNYVDRLNSDIDTAAAAPTLPHADGSVTGPKIKDGAVTTAKIADGAVTAAKLSAVSIDSSKLSDGSVTTAKIALHAVNTGQLADGAVTTAKVADGVLTASKFVPGVLTNETANGLLITALTADLEQYEIDNDTAVGLKANQSDLDATNTIVALKANIVDVNNQIAAVASGSPKATFATVSALTAAFPTGNTNIYLVTADGKWYYWNGSAWTAGGVYQSTGIADNSVAPIKTTFFDPKPAIDLTFTANRDINNSSGGTVSGSYHVSNTVAVEPNATYYFSNYAKLALYYQDGTFKSIDTSSGTNRMLTMASDVYSIKIAASDITNYVFAKSDKVITYDEANLQKMKLANIPDLPKSKVTNLETDLTALQSVFNPKLAIPVTFTANQDISNSTGAAVAGTAYVSGLMPVIPGETYSFTYLTKIAYFLQAGTFKNISLPSAYNQVITIPSDVYFIRFSVVGTVGVVNYVFAKSDKVLPYDEANIIKLKDIALPSNFTDSVKAVFKITDVACYGDSLTEGAGSSNGAVYSYPIRLRGLINSKNVGYTVVNRGVGGEDTNRIIVRQGAYGDYVNLFTIPADTSAVAITKSTGAGANGIKNGVNPVTIKGIEGSLSYTSGTYYFARSVAGESVVVDRPTPILRASSLADKGKIQIFFMGQNGGYTDTADLINQYRRMIDFNGNNKFMVIGLTSGTAAERSAMETEMERVFGINYINMRKYLVNYGLADNALTATAQDNTDISVGTVPTQLRSDSIHLNDYGYYALALAVYARGQELGFWN